jgi:hypothetical protein
MKRTDSTRRLHKFLHLPPWDRRLLIKATMTVGAVRMGLWALPFRILRRIVSTTTRAADEVQTADLTTINRVVWAVWTASRYVPAATCLTQALATQVLLGRRKQPACLRVGVAKGEDGQLQAHAWVESDGVVIIGGSESELGQYTPLLTVDGAMP